jgi:galactokinase
MAIENDAIMAVGVREDTTVNLKHMHYVQHAETDFDGSQARFHDYSGDATHSWINYFVAGYKALTKANGAVGMDIVVDGNVPLGSGLSSSASLVVCSAVATLHALAPTNQMVEDVSPPKYTSNRVVTKNELAELAWTWEVKVGTACGGMDQTISVVA